MAEPKKIQELDPHMRTNEAGDGLVWHEARALTVEGKAFADTERFFDRLPARAEPIVTEPVWELSRCSAGMSIRFQTTSPRLAVRWSLFQPTLAMSHMAATGVSGLDLYTLTPDRGWRFLAAARPEHAPDNEVTLVEDLPKTAQPRSFTLHLPLYNGINRLEIGVPEEHDLTPLPPRMAKPILFYGTSILQGGCASRPGMAYPTILGRRLNRPTLNFGFSGNGKMHPELAPFLAELDPAVFVIDPLPNMSADLIRDHALPFLQTLRDAHPDTPILLVEDPTFCGAFLRTDLQHNHATRRAAFREVFNQLQRQGDQRVTYSGGEFLFGADDEATVDGCHATDLGFLRMADALDPVLRALL